MIDCRFVPVVEWPGKKTVGRENSRFDTAYSKTLDLLERELRKLGGKDILIQAYFRREDIRNDGWPKANARPSEPGVILTFGTDKSRWDEGSKRWVKDPKTFSFPCDRFRDWESNLRAIALALEALRMVDRYGVTQTGQQYRGWEQLPPTTGPGLGMTAEQAAGLIADYSVHVVASDVLTRWDRCEPAIRAAYLASHPDKQGGNQEAFLRVQQAAKVLRARHGV